MKISKIASVALLGALIATNASADAKSDYTDAVATLEKKQGIADTIVNTLERFYNLGWDTIKAWDGSSANIKDLFDAIFAIQPGDISGSNITTKVDLGGSQTAIVVFTPNASVSNAKIEITDPNIESGTKVTITGDTDKTNYNKVFTDEAKEDLKKIYDALVSQITRDNMLKSYIEDKNNKEIIYASSLTSQKELDADSAKFLASKQAEVKQISKEKIEKLSAIINSEAQRTRDDLAQKIKEAAEAVQNSASDKDTKIAAANDAIKAAIKTKAIDTKLPESGTITDITGETSHELDDTNLAVGNKTDIETIINTLTRKTVRASIEAAKIGLKALDDILSSSIITQQLDQDVETKLQAITAEDKKALNNPDLNTLANINKIIKENSAIATKLTEQKTDLESKIPTVVAGWANSEDENVTKAKTALSTITNENNKEKLTQLKTKIEALKTEATKANDDAKKVSLMDKAVANATGGLTINDSNGRNVNDLSNATTLYGTNGTTGMANNKSHMLAAFDATVTAIDAILATINQALSPIDEIDKKIQATNGIKSKLSALQEAEVLLNNANIAKVDSIVDATKNAKAIKVLEGLKDIGTLSNTQSDTESQNSKAADILTKGKADTLLALANNISSSAAETAKAINTDAALQAIRVNASLSTDTRLAKLASPHKNDIALAKAINATSGDRFADGGDSVNEVIKAYTTRFKNDNNLWANVIGTKASIKNGISPTMFGFSVGYDKAFDNTILGGYASYAQGNGSNSNLSIKANTYELGAYSRTYIDQSEIDAKIAIGQTRNKLERSVFNSVNSSYLQQNAKFDTTYFNIDTTYGYVFDLGNALFVKPFAGLEYGYSKNKSFDERGDLPLSFSGVKNKTLSAKLGAELRKYVDNENYIYIAPAIISELYKSKSNPSVKFIGSNQEFDIATNKKKNTYFGLNTGISTNITQNTSLNVNFGTKLGSKEKYYNGLVGVKYSF